MKRVLMIALMVGLAAAGCEKSNKGSGALSASESNLFKSLPAGAPIAFGGNYMKLQNFMSTTLGSQLGALGSGMKTWTECFLAIKDIQVAGTVQMADRGMEMRLVMTGLGVHELADCATKAGFQNTVDPDGKFVKIQMPGAMLGDMALGYLQLPSGGVYARQSFALGGSKPTLAIASRPDLEADLASLKATAADDAKLQALIGKVDRGKTVWFAGTAAGTKLADTVGEAYGTLDFASGVAIDLSFEVLKPELADEIEKGAKQAKDMASMAPGDLGAILEALKVKRDGNRFHISVAISESQIASALKQLGGLRGFGRM